MICRDTPPTGWLGVSMFGTKLISIIYDAKHLMGGSVGQRVTGHLHPINLDGIM